MADTVSKEHRSWNMRMIRSSNTKPEQLVRLRLWHDGYRYRKNDKSLPGKPDIVLPRYKTAIFINGCFWHRHENCRYASTPKSNVDYWQSKFKRNIENDRKNKKLLEEAGWHVITIWECEINKDLDKVILNLENDLKTQDRN